MKSGKFAIFSQSYCFVEMISGKSIVYYVMCS